MGESKGRDLPVVIRAKAGMTPLHVRGGRVTQRITRAAKQWPGTRYHAGMFAKPDLHVAPVTPERIDAVRALRVAPEQEPFVGATGFNLDDALRDENSEAMAILVGATPGGFYRLDFSHTNVARRSISETSAGLRAFFLDVEWPGRGRGPRQ